MSPELLALCEAFVEWVREQPRQRAYSDRTSHQKNARAFLEERAIDDVDHMILARYALQEY